MGRLGWMPLLLAALLPHLSSQDGDIAAHRRFEYKFSFKGPHLSFPIGDVPFWSHFGDAIPGLEEVRLVPSLRSKSGSMWTKYNASFEHWGVEISFRITGRGRNGADGLAVWYTRQRGDLGSVYGAADLWDGIGIFFDTFDNDDRKNNPIILVVGNNGKLIYDHSNDGASQVLGACVRNFRNTPHPFRARITYYKKTLSISINPGLSPEDTFYEPCTEVKNMVIPQVGFFGVSAATGGLADDHDVLSFLTFSLSDTWKEAPGAQIPDSEKERFQKDFDQFEKELEKQKEDFAKQHPQGRPPVEDLFESDSQRELEMVVDGQNRVLRELGRLSDRLDMASEEQKRQWDLLQRTMNNGTTTTVKGEQGQADSADLEAALNGRADLFQMLQEVRANIVKVTATAKDLHQSSGAGAVPHSSISDIKEHIDIVKRSLQSLAKNPAHGHRLMCPAAPAMPACVSSGSFLLFLLIQTICTMCYLAYRSKKEASLKKFF
ncbi:protein ERGIC-53-like [Ambystoma mexicanum]|uniref:protein ERGIC-53-like n=1 Tax=Ambystoma mexicanum TaxID=8296 RepID=UPI0037E93019